MIRVFELFCKQNFINISAKDFYLKSINEFQPNEHKCPFCSAKNPGWKKHGVYNRYLISFENGHTVTYRITVVRYRCKSCGHTHAILPECIIPYQSYSFLFILAVLKDYFSRSLVVKDICIKYNISVSTLYSWIKLFLKHKKIWFGLLENAYSSSLEFLKSLFIENHLFNLKKFYLTAGISFLQSRFNKKKAHFVPV
jgi:transposase-like protein